MRKLTIIILLFTLISCHKQVKNEQAIKYSIDLDAKKELVNDFTDILEVNRIIPLKGKLIGSIDKLIYFENKLIIFDKHLKCIDVFSGEGNYLNSIGNIGKGPNEFVSPLDITVANTGELYLLDDTKQIKIYSLSGTFIDKIALPTYFLKLEVLRNKQIALLNPSKKFMKENDKNSLYIFSDKGRMLASMLRMPKDQEDCDIVLRTNFQKVSDEVHVVLPFNDTIYNIKNNQAEIQSIIKYNNLITPAILKVQSQTTKGKPSINDLTNNYSFNFWFYLESEKFLVFSYLSKRKVKAVFFNKDKNKFSIYNYANLSDPLACLDPLLLYDNDSLISLIHPEEFLSKDMQFRLEFMSANNPDLSDQLKKLRSNMKIEDNPFVVFSKLKNN